MFYFNRENELKVNKKIFGIPQKMNMRMFQH